MRIWKLFATSGRSEEVRIFQAFVRIFGEYLRLLHRRIFGGKSEDLEDISTEKNILKCELG